MPYPEIDAIQQVATRFRETDALFEAAWNDAVGMAVDDVDNARMIAIVKKDRFVVFEIHPTLWAEYKARPDTQAALDELNILTNSVISLARDDFHTDVARIIREDNERTGRTDG